MPGKPRLLTDEQIERARRLVESGTLTPAQAAERFGVKTSHLVRYGIRTPEKKAKGAHVNGP